MNCWFGHWGSLDRGKQSRGSVGPWSHLVKAEVEEGVSPWPSQTLRPAGNTKCGVGQVWDSREQWRLWQAGESSGQACPSECRPRVAGTFSFLE